ncbi:hypothetical protein QCA50_008867 [Cerrena zonata]|uniref:chorismate mutase n=1 Tax=Cerrena zonata TaxID=2478898 RepID=A0AAW0G5I4_9APHY
MLVLCRLYAVACFAVVALCATTRSEESTQATDSFYHPTQRPNFPVPTLIQVRTILSQLEGPIISKLTERFNIAAPLSFYSNNGAKLLQYLKTQESIGQADGRYSYGKLEYPFTLSPISPDVTSKSKPFTPGTFHEDGFTENQKLFKFYLTQLVPLFSVQTSPFFHLDNSTLNEDATFNLDATLLQLISHRSSIGKVVAESKYAANVTGFTSLIKTKDSTNIRVLLTNTTQEDAVMQQASTAASGFSSAWVTAGASEPPSFGNGLQNVTSKLFRELIDVTTDIEVQYILNRLH